MFQGLSDEKKQKKAKELFTESSDNDATFQQQAMEDFGYHDGTGQWTDAERKILKDEMRPCFTFNLIKGSTDLVKGMNEDIKVRYIASPVEPTDGFLAEVLNNVAYHIMGKADFDAEEDAAFESGTICGRGWNAIDFVPNPKRLGHIRLSLTSIPVNEVKMDFTSRKDDISDSGYIFWDKWLSVEDFKIKHPKFAKDAEEILKTGTVTSEPYSANIAQDVFEVDTGIEDDALAYSKPLDTSFYDKSKKMIRVVHMEYWLSFPRHYGFNPETQQFEEFSQEDLNKLKKIFPIIYGQELEYVTLMDKKVMWLQFTGDRTLYDGDSPLPYDGFSIVPCFAYKDVSGKSINHYGIVRLIKDPQKEVNKRWSQTTNLLNQQVQPGVYAETDAFVDQAQAEASLKTAGSVTYLNKGAIKQGKFLERKMPTFPDAPLRLEEFAQNMIRRISGINPDLLGMDRGRQEPGIVVKLRQQQGLVLLKPLFTANKRLKKANFERVIAIIMAYMPDEQILSILGENERYKIMDGMIIDKKSELMANIRDVRNLRFNIEAEEVPGNRSSRMLELSVYLEMQRDGFTVDPRIIIDKLDLPQSEKQDWIEYIEAQQKAAQQKEDREFELELLKLDIQREMGGEKVAADAGVKHRKVDEQTKKDDDKFLLEVSQLNLTDKGQELDYDARMAQVRASKESSQGARQ